VQAIVSFPTVYQDIGGASLPIAVMLQGAAHSNISEDGRSFHFIDFDLVHALYSGLFSSSDADFSVKALCATNNCTWPEFETLAVCNSCADLSSHLSATVITTGDAPKNSTQYTLPNGFMLGGLSSGTTMDYRYYSVMNVSVSNISV
jgi:hypothetical protein